MSEDSCHPLGLAAAASTRQLLVVLPMLLALAGQPEALSGSSRQTAARGRAQESPPHEAGEGMVSALIPTSPVALERLVREVLERNPSVALSRRMASAEAEVAPQAKALPDPMVGLTLFILPPETRVGPQRLSASIAQKFPWFGKLGLRERAALYGAAAATAGLYTVQLDMLTEARRLFYELAFLEEFRGIVEGEREILRRHEEAARARYSAGSGLQQEIVRIQAQITRIDDRLLDIRKREATVLAAINALRDRTAGAPIEGLSLPRPIEPTFDEEGLRRKALQSRPELVAADARIAQRSTLADLARKNFAPDFTVGLGYSLVDKRDDAPGRVQPPSDNGQDVLGLSGAVNIPIQRGRLNAGLRESLERQFAEEEGKRHILASIERGIGDVAARLPLLFEQWQLLEGVLLIQAEEALRSAEAAYSTGRLNAVDLLDAEVVLFEVRTAIARTRTDFARGWVDLEREVAEPLALVDLSTER